MGNTLAAELSAASARVFRAAWQLATAPIAKKRQTLKLLSTLSFHVFSTL
jgi:hypothetical protein